MSGKMFTADMVKDIVHNVIPPVKIYISTDVLKFVKFAFHMSFGWQKYW